MKPATWGTIISLLILSACQDTGGATSTTTSPRPASVVTTTTTAPTTATTASTTTEDTTTSTAATTTTLPEFPPEKTDLEHGGEVWAVVLAASEDFDDPLLIQAVSDADDAGYTTGPTDCDVGAAEALGLPDEQGYYTVSVYLHSEADAEAARTAFAARAIEGTVALVQTFCLD